MDMDMLAGFEFVSIQQVHQIFLCDNPFVHDMCFCSREKNKNVFAGAPNIMSDS
jgi:hypothetical protein